jgi:hypothetical protein
MSKNTKAKKKGAAIVAMAAASLLTAACMGPYWDADSPRGYYNDSGYHGHTHAGHSCSGRSGCGGKASCKSQAGCKGMVKRGGCGGKSKCSGKSSCSSKGGCNGHG